MSKIKENAIGIAVPTGHETVFFEPVVVRSLSSGINLGMAFFGMQGGGRLMQKVAQCVWVDIVSVAGQSGAVEEGMKAPPVYAGSAGAADCGGCRVRSSISTVR